MLHQMLSDQKELKVPEYGLLGEQGKGAITSCYREQIQSAEHSKDVEKSLW